MTDLDLSVCPFCGHRAGLVSRYCPACKRDRREAEIGTAVTDPAFSRVYRSAGTRAKVVIGLFGLVGAISLLTLIQDLGGFEILRRAETGTLTNADAIEYDTGTQRLAIAYLVAVVCTGIAFFAWLSRSVDNVPALTGRRPITTPRWSIGWWFVPVANLVQPYRIVHDLLRRMQGPGRWTWIVLAWWLLWIASNVAATWSLGMSDAATVEALREYFTSNVIVDVLDILAVILAIVVVLRIQRAAEARGLQERAMATSAIHAEPRGTPAA